MNKERFAGMCLQLAGTVKQAWGELTGDPRRVSAGKREQVIGKARQASGSELEESARQLKDFRHQHRNWHS